MTTETCVDEPRLLAIDGLNIVRRCYEANPAPDSLEKAKSAASSSFFSIRRALEEHSPTHVLAAFDFGGHTWRHDLYAKYREKRKPMPEELRAALPDLKDRLTFELGLEIVCIPGVEADDVIGAGVLRWLACKAAPAVVLSTDKDLAVLIADGALVYDHFKREWHDADWVQNKFGVGPELLGDFLALTGDVSDDIPGVTGVGDKTAAKLLNQHGSLEKVLAEASTIKGKLGENLVGEADLARLSRQLVALRTELSLGVSWKTLRYYAPEPVAA